MRSLHFYRTRQKYLIKMTFHMAGASWGLGTSHGHPRPPRSLSPLPQLRWFSINCTKGYWRDSTTEMTRRTWWCSAPTSRSFSQGLDCELGVNYDETELALYLALEMETDVIPGARTCNKDGKAESHLFLQRRDRMCVRTQ